MPQIVGKKYSIKKLGEKLRGQNYDQTIILGNFNRVMDPEIDRSTMGKKNNSNT